VHNSLRIAWAFRRGRTFGTVLVNLESHRIVDLLPDRRAQIAAAWMRAHPEISVVSRDRGDEHAAAVKQGAPQALEVADRFHITKNLTETVQRCLSRLLIEMKEANQKADSEEQQQTAGPLPVEEWRPAQDEEVKQAIATRHAEHRERYQQIVTLHAQGLRSKEIATRLGMKERAVRRLSPTRNLLRPAATAQVPE
jgi:transposase